MWGFSTVAAVFLVALGLVVAVTGGALGFVLVPVALAALALGARVFLRRHSDLRALEDERGRAEASGNEQTAADDREPATS